MADRRVGARTGRRRRSPEATVSFATVEWLHGKVPMDPVSELEAALEPGTTVTRYGRAWHMAAHRWEDARYVIGEIGFEQAGAIVPRWDPTTNTFARQASREGATSPFVIDVETFRVAFQLRGKTIQPGTFRYNFQALLNEANDLGWRVRLEGVSQPPWEEFVAGAERITKVEVYARKPNPRDPGKELDDFYKKTQSAAIKIGAEAVKGGSLNLTDDELLYQAIELAKDTGSIKADAEVSTPTGPEKQHFDTAAEGKAPTERVPADPETGEAQPESMRRVLEDGGDQE